MLFLAAIVIAAVAGVIGYAIGRARGLGEASHHAVVAAPAPAPGSPTKGAVGREELPEPAPTADPGDGLLAERARLLRSCEAEGAWIRRELVTRDAAIVQLRSFADERRRLLRDLATARGEIARYRQLVVDLEADAPPAFFGAGAPDDLKLIVGIGPVLERMLQMLGVATYRQIARWSERDIDEIDAKLTEFPGRIRRDAWVTQARELHQSKYGEVLPSRERR